MDLILRWTITNPSGFWLGLILPIVLALLAAAIKSNKKIVWTSYHWKIYLMTICLGSLIVSLHIVWFWPRGIVTEGNLAYLQFIMVPVLFWNVMPSLRGKSDLIDAPSTYIMAWTSILIFDVVVSFLQPGFLWNPTGIGGDGLKDGLMIIPIGSVIWCYLAPYLYVKLTKLISS